MNKMPFNRELAALQFYSKSCFWFGNRYNVLTESVINLAILRNVGLTLAMNMSMRKEYIGA